MYTYRDTIYTMIYEEFRYKNAIAEWKNTWEQKRN